MIQIEKNYRITLTEDQAQQLYRLLQSTKEFSYGERYDELGFLHDELKKIFDSGIRSTESFESAKDYNHIYAPGTK
jgi:uncharacterized protein YqgQ